MTNSIAQAHLQGRYAVCVHVSFAAEGHQADRREEPWPRPREQEPAPGGPSPGHAHLRWPGDRFLLHSQAAVCARRRENVPVLAAIS